MVKSFPEKTFCQSTALYFNKPRREGYRVARKEKLNMEVIINYDCFSNCLNVEYLAISHFVKHCSALINLQLIANGTQAFTNAEKI